MSRLSCLDRLNIVDKVSALKDNSLPLFLEVLRLESCEIDNDPMRILGSLCHLKDLWLGSNSYAGKRMTCPDGSFPRLAILNLRGLANLEDWTLWQRSMPKLEKLIIMNCGKLKCIPQGLPSSVLITCSPCINGIEKYGTCICYRGTSLGVFDKEVDFFIGIPAEIGKKTVDLLEKNHKVVLVGGCGLSKASIANMLYQQQEIKTRFDAIAWARCPHRHTNIVQFILGLLSQLAPETTDKNSFQKSCSTLSAELEEVMGARNCLIVLTEMIDSLRDPYSTFLSRLPKSKMLLTSHAYSGSVSDEVCIEQAALSDEESLALFQKRLGAALTGIDGAKKNEMGSSMLKHCLNRQSSILLLAGLLAMKQTLIEWQSIEKELDLRMEKAQGPEPIMHGLSYDDLPPHLKQCFLYLSILPDDMEISTRGLTRMWIAAGFVRLKDDESAAIELMESVAESYLNELVIRGLVQVGKRGPTGRISTCYVHIVMQSLCSAKATEERFVMEHLALDLNQGQRQLVENTASKSHQLRSLLFFPKINDIDNFEHNWVWFIKLCNKFRLLHVLDLEGIWFCKGVLPTEVGYLNQLRYLSRDTRVSELPPTFQQLINLETLDLRVMERLFIPDVLFRFRCLRHLHLPDSIAVKSPKLQLQGLDHLRTLANLNTEKVHLDCLSELKSLTRITVSHIHEQKEFNDKFKFICTRVDVRFNSEIFQGNPSVLSSSQILERVTIKGEIPIPLDVGMFPECMKELTLKHTKLKNDHVLVLGKLSGLTRLVMDHESFIEKKMTFPKGSFPQLTHLRLRLLSKLEELDMTEAEHLSRLQSIDVKDCWRLNINDFKFVSSEIRAGPLRNHPLLGLLRPKYNPRRLR